MTELEAKAKDCIENHTHKLVDKPTKQDIYLREESIFISGYKLGAAENGVVWHKNKKVPLCKGTMRIILYDNWREPSIVSASSELEFISGQENHIIAWCEVPQFKET